MNLAGKKKRAALIIEWLRKAYPEVDIALNFSSPFELLIATILSAQCTDIRVNIVTQTLFKKYKLPEDYIRVPATELEKDIYSTGFYKQKAKHIRNCCSCLIEEHQGKVPEDFDELCKLPGVGRKTASVIAGNAYGMPAIAVDTHVRRISNLLELADSQDPEKIEYSLKEVFNKKDWVDIGHMFATLGRNVCFARKPKCGECVISRLCPSCRN